MALSKVVTQNQMNGQRGEHLVAERSMAMGMNFDGRNRLEAGVDGFIELRDPATRQMLARWIGVQVKTTADGSYTSEDETGFSYLLKPEDLEYWGASNIPVIIVLVRLSDNSMYWKPVGDGLPTEPRRLVFNKAADKFDVSAADAIAALCIDRHRLGSHVPPMQSGEPMHLTMLRVVLPDEIYVGESLYASGRDAVRALSEAEVQAHYEWVVRKRRFLSFRDPNTTGLTEIVEEGTVEAVGTELVATTEDVDDQNMFIELLSRTLSAQEARPATMRIRAFIDEDATEADGEAPSDTIIDHIARQLVVDFRDDARGLVFANSRPLVEHLAERCEHAAKGEPLLFVNHHSSIKASDRRRIESWMRGEGDDVPERVVVIATNTLELGIDIGRVQRVVQIDPTFTVSALRQRVGRSGRRNEEHPNGLLYVREQRLTEDSHPLDRLRLKTVQAAATAQLAMEGQFEQPNLTDLHLSTLYHQVISILRQRTFSTTKELYATLVEKGPWGKSAATLDSSFFARLLETFSDGRDAAIEFVDGTSWKLVESLDKRRHSYTVFATPPDYLVSSGGVVVGRLPMTASYRVGDTFVLNRGRWRVTNVSDERRTLSVVRAPSAGAPRFGGTAQVPSGVVSARMLAIYQGHDVSGLALDDAFEQLIAEGRAAYKNLGLASSRLLETSRDVVIFPWQDARSLQTLVLALRREGLRSSSSHFAVLVEGARTAEVVAVLKRLKGQPLPELDELAREARSLRSDKFDRYLIPYHQRLAYAHRHLSGERFAEMLDDVLANT